MKYLKLLFSIILFFPYLMLKKKQTFTHFISIPFISQQARSVLKTYQSNILFKAFKKQDQRALNKNNPNHFHITLCMLSLTQQTRPKAKEVLASKAQVIRQILSSSQAEFTDLQAFQGRNNLPNVLYLDIKQNQVYQRIMKVSDVLIRQMIKQEVIMDNELKSMHISYDHNKGLYKPDKLHLTMFRVDDKISGQVDWKEAMENSKVFSIKGTLPVEYVDISTRFEYDETGYFKPHERVKIQ